MLDATADNVFASVDLCVPLCLEGMADIVHVDLQFIVEGFKSTLEWMDGPRKHDGRNNAMVQGSGEDWQMDE